MVWFSCGFAPGPFPCRQVNIGYLTEKNTRYLINNWITERINSFLGFEDEVLIGLVVNSLDEEVRFLPS